MAKVPNLMDGLEIPAPQTAGGRDRQVAGASMGGIHAREAALSMLDADAWASRFEAVVARRGPITRLALWTAARGYLGGVVAARGLRRLLDSGRVITIAPPGPRADWTKARIVLLGGAA